MTNLKAIWLLLGILAGLLVLVSVPALISPSVQPQAFHAREDKCANVNLMGIPDPRRGQICESNPDCDYVNGKCVKATGGPFPVPVPVPVPVPGETCKLCLVDGPGFLGPPCRFLSVSCEQCKRDFPAPNWSCGPTTPPPPTDQLCLFDVDRSLCEDKPGGCPLIFPIVISCNNPRCLAKTVPGFICTPIGQPPISPPPPPPPSELYCILGSTCPKSNFVCSRFPGLVLCSSESCVNANKDNNELTWCRPKISPDPFPSPLGESLINALREQIAALQARIDALLSQKDGGGLSAGGSCAPPPAGCRYVGPFVKTLPSGASLSTCGEVVCN